MQATLQKTSREVKCPACEYFWEYRGRSIFYATCPMCRTAVKIGEKKGRSHAESSAKTNQPATETSGGPNAQ